MILAQTDSYVVCVKEAGILSQRAQDRPGLTDILKEETGKEVYPVHRLDRETGGVMVYALTAAAAADLSRQITENKFSKEYYAVLKGSPEKKEGELEDLLFRDSRANKTYVVSRMRKGVRRASLEYKLKAEREGLALAEIRLHTGRTHQIRVQFASRGLPVYGDGRYGAGKGDLALFAKTLAFDDPETKERKSFTALPDTAKYPWSLFEEEL